eukprot:1184697-Lingulodinium_polyedra.AAC.1
MPWALANPRTKRLVVLQSCACVLGSSPRPLARNQVWIQAARSSTVPTSLRSQRARSLSKGATSTARARRMGARSSS